MPNISLPEALLSLTSGGALGSYRYKSSSRNINKQRAQHIKQAKHKELLATINRICLTPAAAKISHASL